MRNRTILDFCLPIVALCGALLSGCADTAEGTAAPLVDAGPVDASIDSTVAECTIFDEGAPRACTCGAASGRQICFGGKYTACECITAPDSGSGGGELCAAGYYTGEFTGKYKPGAFGLGIFGSFIEFDIAGVAAAGNPALSFTLEMSSGGGGGEFETYTVKNGCMLGSAMAVGTNNPFVAKLEGELNCQTGRFEGTITGNYDFVQSSLKFQFTGPLSAQFENPQKRLKDGIWNVKEPPALDGTPAGGGGGKWSAIYSSPTPPAGADPCASLVLPDGGAGSADAGSADAGVGGDI